MTRSGRGKGMERVVTAGLVAGAFGLLVTALVVPQGCSGSGRSRAERIAHRSQLIGGPDALGDIGDFKLSNGKVRFVIQGIRNEEQLYSRGWGVYAGSLLDADLVRPDADEGGAANGRDSFGELFPAYFLEAIEPEGPNSVRVINDGSNGDPASVVVEGRGAPFLSTAKLVTDAILAPANLAFRVTYSLGANDQFLTIRSELINKSNAAVRFPAAELLGIKLAIPLGQVLLFGGRQEVFVEGAGFDLRHALEAQYDAPARLPALPGVVSELVATRSETGVSYGYVLQRPKDDAEAELNYTWRNRDKIPDAKRAGMLVPFIASSFTGVFGAQPPDLLPAASGGIDPLTEGGDHVFGFTSYFVVGQGDVGSVRDVAYQAQGVPTGRFAANLRESGTNRVIPGASLVVLDSNERPYSQYSPDADGRVTGRLPAGDWKAVVVTDNHFTTRTFDFNVREGWSAEVVQPATDARAESRTLEIPQSGRVNVRVTEAGTNRPVPAKVTAVGIYPWSERNVGRQPKEFLYDLTLGERMRPTDGVADTETADGSRQFVERVLLAGADGRASGTLKPGKYTLIASRGPEYDAVRVGEVEITPGAVVDREVVLARVVDTPAAIGADFHVHGANSIDGTIQNDDRVRSFAAEGVELMVATDHNFVTDYRPTILNAGLEDFLQSTVGLEMTTLEMGHFNAFPIKYQPGPITHGAFDWVNVGPIDLFTKLRGLGDADTVVQVNHPRDTILGYFNQFNLSPETGLPRRSNPLASPQGPAFALDQFSNDYDAIEVFNGKRYEFLSTYRMPAVAPPGSPSLPIGPGEIVRLPCPEGGCDYSKQEIAYPGALDDWFNIINNPDRDPVTATGNSDSHGLYFEEAGYPRNFVFVDQDDPKKVTDAMLSAAVKRHEVVFSNGPYIAAIVDGQTGSTARVGGMMSTTEREVLVTVSVRAAPWIDVKRVLVYKNGVLFRTVNVENDRTRAERCCEQPIRVPVDGDAWIVVAAEGDESMWPIVTPLEEPPLVVSDAIAAIAGPLGIGDNGLGPLRPDVVRPVTPFAMTNPIWVDRDGSASGGPDGRSFGRRRDVGASGGQGLVGTRPGATVSPLEAAPVHPIRKREASDLRKIFRGWGALGGHHHSH